MDFYFIILNLQKKETKHINDLFNLLLYITSDE